MEIKELNNKYLVLKWDDIRNALNDSGFKELDNIIESVTTVRENDGKLPQSYVVLNQRDDCDIDYLSHKINQLREKWSQVSIKTITLDLINSIQLCNVDN